MITEITNYVWCSYMVSGQNLQVLYGNMLNDFDHVPSQTDIKNGIIDATNEILKENNALPENMQYDSCTLFSLEFLTKEAFEQLRDKQ